MNCSYVNCRSVEIQQNDNRVEIKTKLPKEWDKIKSRDSSIVKWQSNGEAVFHSNCWDVVFKSSRSRKRKSDGTFFIMTSQEKMLVKEAAKTSEQFDSLVKVKYEAEKVAKMIQKSCHCVVFTGAGISTSAGIGDYRGKSGKWTEMDQEKINIVQPFSSSVSSKNKNGQNNSKDETNIKDYDDAEDDGVKYEELRPTYTHEAIVKLMELGYVKYVISQNGDGLHTLSGIPEMKISELHGNVFQEKCEKCNKIYDRSFYVMDDVASQYYEELEDYGKTNIIKPKYAKQCETCGLSHRTGRRCDTQGCQGYLKDTIINFGDLLEVDIMARAEENTATCDLLICLGSTLTVTPACDLVSTREPGSKLVICNRQETEMDGHCNTGSRIFGDCDVFFTEVMKHMLSAKKLKAWQDDRMKRLEMYDAKRQNSLF